MSAFYVSRHAPTLNARIESAVQVLLPEDVTLNGTTMLKGHLLLPGTPTLLVNPRASVGGVIDGSGSATPDGHRVIVEPAARSWRPSSGASTRSICRRSRRRRPRPARRTSW